jgi:type 1 glutamine amidotransferase
VVPSLVEQEALRAYIEGGGRWYALHGTNSILRIIGDLAGPGVRVDAPDWAPHFMETLGSRFLAHPPIASYRVNVSAPEHPLVKGIEPFETDDELYLGQYYGKLEVFLDVEYGGEIKDFMVSDWPRDHYPVYYLKRAGAGAVLYLTLGHCRGHYDMQPAIAYWPSVDRGSWALPQFHELLRRGVAWAKREM